MVHLLRLRAVKARSSIACLSGSCSAAPRFDRFHVGREPNGTNAWNAGRRPADLVRLMGSGEATAPNRDEHQPEKSLEKARGLASPGGGQVNFIAQT